MYGSNLEQNIDVIYGDKKRINKMDDNELDLLFNYIKSRFKFKKRR